MGSHLPWFMIAPQQKNPFRRVYFHAKNEQKDLDGKDPPVNIVPQK